MPNDGLMPCDGCGVLASAAHTARRLKRLESMSRYRPIHVQALFLAAAAPLLEKDYLYSAAGAFSGEAAALLRGLGVEFLDKNPATVLAEFQRRGYLLTYLMDCPTDVGLPPFSKEALLRRLPGTLTRIRRSFKPRRLVPIGPELDEFLPQLAGANSGAALILRDGKSFEWHEIEEGLISKELAAPLQAV